MAKRKIKWEAEASALSGAVNLEEFVYRNTSVDMYISSQKESQPFVVACKGMGKTLLLHYRRQICEKEYEGSVILPSDHRAVDFPEKLILGISDDTLRKLSDYDFCKRFWSVALKLYILAGIKMRGDEIIDRLRDSDKKKYGRIFSQVLSGEPKSIGYVVNELLRLNTSQLSLFIDSVALEIQPVFDKIHTSVFVFLDQLDQAFAEKHKPIWITMQNALLDAAWDIDRINEHVEIFLSIRKEAYTSLSRQSNNANAIFSSVVQIEYEKDNLKEMLNHLVQFYENKADIYDFLGYKTFHNATTYDDEDIFDFMYRYSIGRPRDFVEMCYGLSLLDETKRNKRDAMKRSICHTAGDKIISGLYKEQGVLLKCLTTEERFHSFLKLLRKNVYSKEEITEICKRYNGHECQYECAKCSNEHHPFCDLYNMGLLGAIDNESSEEEQRFKTPYEHSVQKLINSEFYMIHPALREYINRINSNYHLVKGILVGHELKWLPEYSQYYRYDIIIERIIDKEEKKQYEKCFETYLKNLKGIIQKEIILPEIKTDSTSQRKYSESLTGFLKNGEITMPTIKVFITFAYDGDENTNDLIDGLRTELRKAGIDAEHYMSAVYKNRDLDILMKKYITKSDKVIIVLSEAYKEKADNSIGGVWREYQIIRNDMEENPNKYILTCMDSFDKKTMYPVDLGNKFVVSEINSHPGFNRLLSFINDISEYSSDISDTVVKVRQKTSKPFFKD